MESEEKQLCKTGHWKFKRKGFHYLKVIFEDVETEKKQLAEVKFKR
jgi:hypothetical protein